MLYKISQLRTKDECNIYWGKIPEKIKMKQNLISQQKRAKPLAIQEYIFLISGKSKSSHHPL